MLSRYRIISQKISYAVCVALFSTILVGCDVDSGEDLIAESAKPDLNNSSNFTPIPEITSTVLEACDLEAQESVLISGMIPDWNTLPLSACYELWLNLHDDSPKYDGRAIITYSNLSDESLTDLVFRLFPNSERVYGGDLMVTSANVDGIQVDPEVFLADKTGLRLSLDESIKPGDTAVIELEFSGHLTEGLENSPDTYGIFNYAEEESLVTLTNWYPILAIRENGQWQVEPVVGVGDAVVSEVGLYLVEVTTPKDMQIATTGSSVQHSTNDNTEVYRFASGPVRDFNISASPNFVLTEAESNGVQVRQWGLPGGEQRWEEGLQSSIDSLEVFNELFGPYPYKEMDIVSLPLQRASGVEYPGLILMKDELYHLDSERPYLLTTIMAHEVAHQWWYALIGNDVIEHPWQDEALTTFSSLLYLEQFQPPVYDGTVDYFRNSAEEVEMIRENTDLGQPVSSFEDQPAEYSPVIYSKGAIFFVELRKKIGDKAFFQALQTYTSQNLYRIASPGSLLDEFEKACQCDLSEFYQQWGVEYK
jgi:hypothetical protein